MLTNDKTKIRVKDYGYDAVENYRKYTKDSEATKADIDEIVLQYLMEGYDIDRVSAFWAWLKFCESIKSAWKPVTNMYNVPQLLGKYLERTPAEK